MMEVQEKKKCCQRTPNIFILNDLIVGHSTIISIALIWEE
jgi:hypothetical protein